VIQREHLTITRRQVYLHHAATEVSVPIAKRDYARNVRVSIGFQGSPRMSQVRLMLKLVLKQTKPLG
jgi:hypothetical protein